MPDLRRFLFKALLFASPLVLWTLFIVLVDPFNYFAITDLISREIKIQQAARVNTLLFNMVEAARSPHENLVIGDSRAENLPIKEIPGDYHLLAANALKLNESIDLFYFAARNAPLRNVVFTINFNQFNGFAFADRVHSVEDLLRNPLLYVFDRNVAQAAFAVLKATYSRSQASDSLPPMTKEAFWDYIVAVRSQEHYARYQYPTALYHRIVEMVNFAHQHHIAVTFIIVPHHVDFQSKVRQYGLTAEYIKFKEDMSRLNARVIDYDYLNAITTNRADFTDPIHTTREIGAVMVNEVFRGPMRVGKLVDKEWVMECPKFMF